MSVSAAFCCENVVCISCLENLFNRLSILQVRFNVSEQVEAVNLWSFKLH